MIADQNHFTTDYSQHLPHPSQRERDYLCARNCRCDFLRMSGHHQFWIDLLHYRDVLFSFCMVTQRCLRLRHLEQGRGIGHRLLGHGVKRLILALPWLFHL